MRIEFFVCIYTLHIRKFLGKFFSREKFNSLGRVCRCCPFLSTQIRSGSSINSSTETFNDILEGWVPTEDYFDPPLNGIWYLFLSSHQVNSKIVVQFCYLRLPFVIKTLFFRQLQRMHCEDGLGLKRLGQLFQFLKLMPTKITNESS